MYGDVSGNASLILARWVQRFIPISEYTINFLVRKAAHFFLFALLAHFIAQILKYHIKNPKAVLLIAWIAASAYGVIDEIHQFFVPGRDSSVMDMAINSAGALFGGVIVYWQIQRKQLKILWLILAVATATLTLFFSSMPEEESLRVSLFFVHRIQRFVELGEYPLNFLVRKSAQFFAYALLAHFIAQFAANYIKSPKAVLLTAWIISSVLGVVDEFNQFFIPGRNASLLDIGINSTGALFGAAITFWIIKRHIQTHKEEIGETT